MARRKNELRSVADLPKWYSREPYSKAEFLDAKGWYDQFSIRLGVYRFYQYQRDRFPASPPVLFGNDEIICKIRSNPIDAIAVDDDVRKYFLLNPLSAPLFSAIHGGENIDRQLCIHSLSHMELFDLRGSVPKKKWQYLEQLAEYNNETFSKTEKTNSTHPGYQSWRHAPCNRLPDNDAQRCAVVDFSLPDKVLVEEFKKWLQIERRTDVEIDGNALSRHQRVDFQAWHQYGVLPYMDLTIWALESMVNIPNQIMATAIFPPGHLFDEDIVRRETAPRAKMILGSGNGTSPLLSLINDFR